MIFYMQGELNDPNPAGRHDQCASEWRRGADGRTDGGMGHLSDPSPLRSPSPPSPLDTLPPCLARTSVAAPDPPGFQGGRISSLRWTVMVVRLAPSRPILRRPASAMGMGVRKRRKGAWASAARGELGGREGSKEGRNRDVEVSTYRDRDIILCISMNRAEEGTRKSSSIQRHRRSAAAIKI